MSKILVWVGSTRKGGNTELLAQAFADGAKKNNEIDIISVSDWHLGKEYKTDYITPLFKTAIKACDVIDDKSLRFHHLRHSCCSIMCKLGYKKEDTQSWIGHADGSKVTDRVYNHYDRILDISKLQKYDEALTRKRSST